MPDEQNGSRQAALQVSFDELVRDAAVIRDFEIMLIPGLLQTQQYARYRALEAVRLHGTDESKVDVVVAARMRRQEVLYKPTSGSSSSSARQPWTTCYVPRR